MPERAAEPRDSPPVADAARAAVCETLVCVAVVLRAGCSGPNSRLAFAAEVRGEEPPFEGKEAGPGRAAA